MIFIVHGIPVPQGSKTAYVRGGKAILVEANKKLKPWRKSVSIRAEEAWAGKEPLTGPVHLMIEFIFPRPNSHYRNKAAGALKPTALDHATSRRVGDIDKLTRAVCDSLTGIVFIDDSQVVRLIVTKKYGVTGRAIIGVSPIIPLLGDRRQGASVI